MRAVTQLRSFYENINIIVQQTLNGSFFIKFVGPKINIYQF